MTSDDTMCDNCGREGLIMVELPNGVTLCRLCFMELEAKENVI